MERVEHAIVISKMRTHVLQLRDKYENTAGSTFQTIDDIARVRSAHVVACVCLHRVFLHRMSCTLTCRKFANSARYTGGKPASSTACNAVLCTVLNLNFQFPPCPAMQS